jgi:hypothetical protein
VRQVLSWSALPIVVLVGCQGHLAAGDEFLAQRRWTQAADEYDAASKDSPSPEAQAKRASARHSVVADALGRASIASSQGDFAAALATLARAKPYADGDDAASLRASSEGIAKQAGELGKFQAAQGDLRSARENLRLAAGVDPSFVPPQMTEEQRAEMDLGEKCDRDIIDSCTELGRLFIREGKLTEAELPLRKAYGDEDEEGTLALAQLNEARGYSETARRLRWEALAIDKAMSETNVWYRPGYPQGQGAAFTVNLQPMAFFARRLDIGFEMAIARQGVTEVDGFAGYQHYFTDSVVGYAQALMGGLPQASTGKFNIGADCGLKLVLRNYFGFSAGFGASRGSPIHAQLGVSFNTAAWLVPLLYLGQAL